jgi:UDP-glucose 4-epimerase
VNILLTGGAGYIGSHTAVVLSEAGHEVVLLDNLFNSRKSVLERLQIILGKLLPCVEGDVRDTSLVIKTLQDYKIDAVIHLAGLKAVGESFEKPLDYYANNVQGTISLLLAMNSVNIKKLVFSSSATVYGVPQYLPIDENHPTYPTSPYGRSKLQVEQVLGDLSASDSSWRIISLRYFNPIGAHESGLIGENTSGLPNNLMPSLVQVAQKKLPFISVYGIDYETSDGTGERDYIHVMDLAEGHLAALNKLRSLVGYEIFNLGTGNSTSVFELITMFETVNQLELPRKIINRRKGDIAICFSNSNKAQNQLMWRPKRTLVQACKEAYLYSETVK